MLNPPNSCKDSLPETKCTNMILLAVQEKNLGDESLEDASLTPTVQLTPKL